MFIHEGEDFSLAETHNLNIDTIDKRAVLRAVCMAGLGSYRTVT